MNNDDIIKNEIDKELLEDLIETANNINEINVMTLEELKREVATWK